MEEEKVGDLLLIRYWKSCLHLTKKKATLFLDLTASTDRLSVFGFRDYQAVLWPPPSPDPSFWSPYRLAVTPGWQQCRGQAAHWREAAAANTTGVSHFKAFIESGRGTKTAIKADGEGESSGKEIRCLKRESFLFNPQEFAALEAQSRYDFILPLPALIDVTGFWCWLC